MKTPLLALALTCMLTPAGGMEWQRDVTLHGINFTQVRADRGGLTIGRLKSAPQIAGRPWAADWVHLHPNGVPAGFTAAETLDLVRLRIPVGTWVKQNDAGVVTVCAFPSETVVQGHRCRGTGGPKGVQVAFYLDGALKQYCPAAATNLDGVPCDTGLVSGSIELHENGRLKSCLLSADFTRDGHTYRKGTRLTLEVDGKIASAK